MELQADTLERLVPDQLDSRDQAGLESLALHLERYEFAARHARAGRAVDLACGVGYGTRLLADRRPDLTEVCGIDVSDAAVRYALDRYAGERVRFEAADAMQWNDDRGFETVVSLETLEHLPQPRQLFASLVQMLLPGAVLVASVPTTPTVDLNEHHQSDFSERSFRALGSEHDLHEIDALHQVQRVSPFELVRGERFQRGHLRPRLAAYYFHHPAALLQRLAALARFGFANHYLTIAWKRPV